MRKYMQKGKIKLAVGRDVGFIYLLPTISVSPKMVSWDDDKAKWDKSFYTCTIMLEWLQFYLEFSVNYRNKRR